MYWHTMFRFIINDLNPAEFENLRRDLGELLIVLGLPILEVQACPYPDLVGHEHDRSVCNLETRVLSAALGQEMELYQCRLDGHSCCQFKPTVTVAGASS